MSWAVSGDMVSVWSLDGKIGDLPSQLAEDLYFDKIGKTIFLTTETTNMNPVILKLQARLARANTNHLLHLFLSILTAGFWVPVWIMVTVFTSIKRSRIERTLYKVSAIPQSAYKYDYSNNVRDQYGNPIFPDKKS